MSCRCDVCSDPYERRYAQHLESRTLNGKDLCRKCSDKERGNRKRGVTRSPEVMARAQATRKKTMATRYAPVEISCGHCSNVFVVPYARRSNGPHPAKYCSRDCQWKGHVNPNEGSDSRRDYVCVVCSEPFKAYRKNALVCSKDCLGEFMSVTRRGANNPYYKSDKEIGECLTCGETFIKGRNGIHVGQVRLFCSQDCSRVIDFKGMSINEPFEYPRQWNKKFKEEIKMRDRHCCVLCDAQETDRGHHIHHIDYDKHNLEHSNLTTLCQKCHNMTHSGRDVWREIFADLPSLNREVTDDFIRLSTTEGALRYLIIRKRGSIVVRSSPDLLGYLCIYGQAKWKTTLSSNSDRYVFHQGDFLDIKPDTEYHLTARLNTVLKPCHLSLPSPS